MPTLHVLTRKEELDQSRLADKVVIVLDVLFATSTIVTALQHGAAEVIPVLNEDAARAEALRHTKECYLLAGEKNLEPLPGFASFAPLALIEQDLTGKRLIYSTTNGTVALRQADRAPRVYAAALLNVGAVARHIGAKHSRETLLVVCAGSIGALNLEDFYAAGSLVDRLSVSGANHWTLSDSALAAHGLYQRFEPEECLLRSRVGRIMEQRGHADEVRFAARVDEFAIVPTLVDGRLKQSAHWS